jgi:hypothetical protein
VARVLVASVTGWPCSTPATRNARHAGRGLTALTGPTSRSPALTRAQESNTGARNRDVRLGAQNLDVARGDFLAASGSKATQRNEIGNIILKPLLLLSLWLIWGNCDRNHIIALISVMASSIVALTDVKDLDEVYALAIHLSTRLPFWVTHKHSCGRLEAKSTKLAQNYGLTGFLRSPVTLKRMFDLNPV